MKFWKRNLFVVIISLGAFVSFLMNFTYPIRIPSNAEEIHPQKTTSALCPLLGPYVLVDHLTDLPSLERINDKSACYPDRPRIMMPRIVDYPFGSGNVYVFDAFFPTNTVLVLIGFFHPGEIDWKDIRVYVDDVEAKLIEDYVKKRPNARKITFGLSSPVTKTNVVTLVFSSTDSKTFLNLPILSEIQRRDWVVHGTVFLYDANLLYLNYEHYMRNGFTHFLWYYNGDVFLDNLINYLPKKANILIVPYNIPFNRDGQQGLIPFLTGIYSHMLRIVDWFFYADLDEHLVIRSGEPVMEWIRKLPEQHITYTASCVWAEAQPSWKDWTGNVRKGITSDLVLKVTERPLNCPDRSKTLYHWTFVDAIGGKDFSIGAHYAELGPLFCPGDLIHYHILNYRKGITSGAVSLPPGNHTFVTLLNHTNLSIENQP